MVIYVGGYCKEYTKGKRPIGVMLDDTWFLRYVMILPFSNLSNSNRFRITVNTPDPSKPKADPLGFKWERRKKVGYAPTIRSGCTMALWSNKAMGILFGGVTDEDTNEETLESVFHNDMLACLFFCPICLYIERRQVWISDERQWSLGFNGAQKTEEISTRQGSEGRCASQTS